MGILNHNTHSFWWIRLYSIV